MTKKNYSISEKFRGFYKLTSEGGKFEYINDRKLDILNKDKNVKIVKFVEEKVETKSESDEDSGNEENLSNLSHKDLIEIAKRLGLDSANQQTSKENLIKYIEKNTK